MLLSWTKLGLPYLTVEDLHDSAQEDQERRAQFLKCLRPSLHIWTKIQLLLTTFNIMGTKPWKVLKLSRWTS